MSSPQAEAPAALIRALADGSAHSERALRARLAIDSVELTEQLERLPPLGLYPRKLAGGWSLPEPLNLLDSALIAAELDVSERARIGDLIVLDQVDSTNAELRRRKAPGGDRALVCLAEFQTAGRGRQRRTWISPYAQGLCLSLRWRFSAGAAAGGLSLALGVAVRRALTAQGLSDIQLKWPNDLLVGERKLGGILVELLGTTPCELIAGNGLNWRLPPAVGRAIDQPWTDLETLTENAPPDRNHLAAGVVGHALAALSEFAVAGLEPFVAEWRAADAFAGREIAVGKGAGRLVGTSLGIRSDGSLRLATPGGERRVIAGELELRG